MSYNPYDPQSLDALTGMYESAGALQAQQIAQKYKIDKQSLANQMKIAAMESGDRQAQIEATREYQRGQLEQARQELERLKIPQMQIDQFTAQANQAIAAGELQTKQYVAQSQNAYQMGQLQNQRDEMLQVGIPKMLVDRFTAESQAAIEQGKLGLDRDQMLQIGIPDMLTRRYSAEAQSAYQQGQLGLQAQTQQQQAIEQQRRYALDVAKYGTDLMSQPDRYFQAQQFGAMAPRLLGLEAGAGPTGGPTSGVAQMGNLLSQALAGMGPQQAAPYQLPTMPTMPGYSPGPLSQLPTMPTMPAYNPPPLSALPSFPSGGFAPINMPTAPWAFPTTQVGGMPAPTAAPGGGGVLSAGGGAYPETGYYDPTAYKTAAASDPWGGYLGAPGSGVGLSSDQGGGSVDLGGMMGSGSQSDLAAQWALSYGGAGAYPSYLDPRQYAQYDALPDSVKAQYMAADTGNPYASTNDGGWGTGPASYGGAYGSGSQSDLAQQWASAYGGAGGYGGYSTGQGTYGGPTSGTTPSYYQPYTPSTPSSYGSDDPRIKQIADVAKASPPSPYDGLSDTDANTLRLMESLYKQGGQAMRGGEYERLGTAKTGFLSSAGTLLGYDPTDLIQTYKQYRPTQDDSRLGAA